MGSKVDAPNVPNYEPITESQREIADKSFQISQDQLDWAKKQYADISPYAFDYLESQQRALDVNQEFAEQQLRRYQGEYAPLEHEFTQRALNYNTPERAAQNAARARADVSRSIDAQRAAAVANLASYGLGDPSEMRMAGLDASYRVAKAIGEAQASEGSRRLDYDTQTALMGAAIDVGNRLPVSSAAAYGLATAAGASGLKSANQGYATGADAMGSPTGFLGAANTANLGQAQALNLGYSNAAQGAKIEADSAAATLYGIGNIVGAVGRTAMGMSGMGMFGGFDNSASMDYSGGGDLFGGR